jgi:hypothetical protein
LARLPAGLPLLQPLVRRVLGTTFGGPAFDPATDDGDAGLTGPGSPSWRVIAEPAAIAGGIRGLLLQVAHPLAVAGVHEHSSFRDDPLGRLHRTSAYVTTSTFGSTREALTVARRVRRAHPHVRGVASDGRPYRADDPHLLAWVGVALTSSFLTAHQVWAPGRFADADADRFVLEQSRIAALLDPRVDLDAAQADPDFGRAFRDGEVALPMLDDGTLPHDVASLEAVLDAFEPELGVSPEGREVLGFLRWPPLPASIRVPYLTLAAGAVGSLRRRERTALGIAVPGPAAGLAVRGAGAALTALRVSVGTSPSADAAADRTRRSSTGRAATA